MVVENRSTMATVHQFAARRNARANKGSSPSAEIPSPEPLGGPWSERKIVICLHELDPVTLIARRLIEHMGRSSDARVIDTTRKRLVAFVVRRWSRQ